MRLALRGLSGWRRQQGVAFLALTTLVVVVSAGAVLDRLNELVANVAGDPDQATVEALVEAKAALLFYASMSSSRPGELPCPDVDYDGSADYAGDPDQSCLTLRGWLPFEDLDLNDPRDSDGERLWYAISNDFHQGDTVRLNSDSSGQLTVDGTNDVVAVIIAPLEPIDAGQDTSRPAESDSHNAVTHDTSYLEHDNADGDLGVFISVEPEGAREYPGDPPTFNDRVLAITRTELMAVVEKRVLGEVAQVLHAYRDADWNFDGDHCPPHESASLPCSYPWLSPIGDPNSSAFNGSIGTAAGYLSLHAPNETFATELTMTWAIAGATVTASGTVDPSDLTSGAITFDPANTTCTWPQVSGGSIATVSAQLPFAVDCTAWQELPAICATQTIRRTWTFRFLGSRAVVTPPKSSNHRRRDVTLTDEDPLTEANFAAIDVVDMVIGEGEEQVCGIGELDSDADTTGEIRASNILYELGADDELPAWIVEQNWHHLLYVALSEAAAPGGSGDCATDGNCLNLSGVSPSAYKEALVVIAGPPLSGKENRSTETWTIANYFELDNVDWVAASGSFANDTFEKASVSDGFNDQVRVVSP